MNSLRSESCHTSLVITGLDPVIQSGTWVKRRLNCRIKSGNDSLPE